MNLWKKAKKHLLAFIMCFCFLTVAAPVSLTYAAAPQAETQAAEAVAAEADDDGSMMILMGGALLIIVVAVVVAVSTASSTIFVAANMDIDGE